VNESPWAKGQCPLSFALASRRAFFLYGKALKMKGEAAKKPQKHIRLAHLLRI